eukprot:scaffold54405_cov55-Phaeocystis_antarctica.AAC.1
MIPIFTTSARPRRGAQPQCTEARPAVLQVQLPHRVEASRCGSTRQEEQIPVKVAGCHVHTPVRTLSCPFLGLSSGAVPSFV